MAKLIERHEQLATESQWDDTAALLTTLATALLQGGLLLAQVRRDPDQLRTALDAAQSLLRTASA